MLIACRRDNYPSLLDKRRGKYNINAKLEG
jgi:hypothetical protein